MSALNELVGNTHTVEHLSRQGRTRELSAKERAVIRSLMVQKDIRVHLTKEDLSNVQRIADGCGDLEGVIVLCRRVRAELEKPKPLKPVDNVAHFRLKGPKPHFRMLRTLKRARG